MNTVCLPSDKLLTDCPIVDIQLLTDTVGFENYTRTDYAGLILAFTKDKFDQSPITSTKVGPYACLDPNQYDSGVSALSPIEKDSKIENCTEIDGAYQKL